MNFTTPLEMPGDPLGHQIKKLGTTKLKLALWLPKENETWEASCVEEEGQREPRKTAQSRW